MGCGCAAAAGVVWDAHGVKMAAERPDALREFVAVTGAEEDRARFFLESAGWDLQVVREAGLIRLHGGCGERVPDSLSPRRPKRTVIPTRPEPKPGLMALGPRATPLRLR